MSELTTGQAIDEALDRIIADEGGWSDRNNDKGGPTNHGVTLMTLQHLRPGSTIDDLKALTVDDAKAIYRQQYIQQPGIAHLPPGLIPQVADISVNSGPVRAVKLLQLALGVTADGMLGPNTYDAAQDAVKPDGGASLNNKLVDTRIAFYQHIVEADATQAEFLDGWKTRANKFVVVVPSAVA